MCIQRTTRSAQPASKVLAILTLSLAGTVFLAGTVASTLSSGLQAQDPFGGGGVDPFGAPLPAGGAPPAAGSPLAGTGGPTAAETDPVVLAIRESNPQTPLERTRALQAMLDHGRPDEALRYLKAILAAQPDAAQMAAMDRQFGSALFMRLNRDPRLQPEGRQLGTAVLKAAQQIAQDPQRLDQLVRQLSDPAPQRRVTAITDLRSAGLAAVNPILAAMQDADRAAEHVNLRDALVQLGPAVAEPLVAVLQSDDLALQAQVIEVLGRLQARSAIHYLVRPAVAGNEPPAVADAARTALRAITGLVPNRLEAEQFLRGEIDQMLDQGERSVADNTREVWFWDPQQHGVVRRRVDISLASRVLAARLADDLYRLDPDNVEYRRLFVIANLEAAKRLGGYGRPLAQGPGTAYDKVARLSLPVVEDALAMAIQRRYVGAAIGAAEVLGDIGNEAALRTSSSAPSILVDALRHRNRRVQFAAAMALTKLDPQAAYLGSSFLIETLGYLISTGGEHRVLLVHPKPVYSQSLAGLLMELGFAADSAQTGHQALLAAARQPDYEFVLISPYVDGPTHDELIHLLRRDPRTATLPVGIIARPEQLDAARQFAERDPLTRAFPRPHDVSAISYLVGELIALSPVDRVPREERLEQASAAIDALTRIAENREAYAFYDLLRQEPQVVAALNQPSLRQRATHILGLMATAGAQRSLVELASQHVLPLEVRQDAVRAFAQAVAKRRLMLTTTEILRQYDRYNMSAMLDQDTQQVLGSVLDIMEGAADKPQPPEVLPAADAGPPAPDNDPPPTKVGPTD